MQGAADELIGLPEIADEIKKVATFVLPYGFVASSNAAASV
jgi:hypothetical protein